jgi:DedD protein
MEKPLKQRLIGAIILISLAVIFAPMLVGHKPNSSNSISIEIPEPPEAIGSRIVKLPPAEKEVLAEVSISKEAGVKVKKPTIPEPPKIKPVEGIKAWVVQVGSFSEQKNADNLATKLKLAGFLAFVEQIDGKNGDVYRVRVGPEISKDKADAMQLKLQKEQKLSKAIVVQYP